MTAVFADAVNACSAVAETDVDGDPCRRSSGARFDDEVATTIAPALVDAVALVKRRAPNARLLVVGTRASFRHAEVATR